MKSIKRIIIAVVAIMALTVPAQAQLRFGVKAGVAINDLKLSNLNDISESVINTDNRAGFTGGLMAEFTVPILGVGGDVSVLYARRSAEVMTEGEKVTSNRDYIDIPLNFKWKIGLPVVGKFVTPFITTGPDFSFLLSKRNAENAFKSKAFDTAWNFGFGLQLINKVQVAASYGIGLNKSVSGSDALYSGKNKVWTVTLAWMF